MQYSKPIFWESIGKNRATLFEMQNRVNDSGYELVPNLVNGIYYCDVYFDGKFYKTGKKEYSDKESCIYETLKIIYNKL